MDCLSVSGVGKCVFKPQPGQPSDAEEGWECRPLLGECGTDMMCASVNGVGKCVPKPKPSGNEGCTVGSAECGTEMDCQSVNGVGKCVFKPRTQAGPVNKDLDPEEQRQYFPETDHQMRKQYAEIDPEEEREFFPEMNAEMRKDYDWR